MPLELERELLSGSVATNDTRHAAEVMRWEGKKEQSVNTGVAIREETLLQVEASICTSVSIHRNTCQVQHQQPFLSPGGDKSKRQHDASVVPVLLWMGEDDWDGSKEPMARSSSHHSQRASPLPLRTRRWRRGVGSCHHACMTQVGCFSGWGRRRLQ